EGLDDHARIDDGGLVRVVLVEPRLTTDDGGVRIEVAPRGGDGHAHVAVEHEAGGALQTVTNLTHQVGVDPAVPKCSPAHREHFAIVELMLLLRFCLAREVLRHAHALRLTLHFRGKCHDIRIPHAPGAGRPSCDAYRPAGRMSSPAVSS